MDTIIISFSILLASICLCCCYKLLSLHDSQPKGQQKSAFKFNEKNSDHSKHRSYRIKKIPLDHKSAFAGKSPIFGNIKIIKFNNDEELYNEEESLSLDEFDNMIHPQSIFGDHVDNNNDDNKSISGDHVDILETLSRPSLTLS